MNKRVGKGGEKGEQVRMEEREKKEEEQESRREWRRRGACETGGKGGGA